MRAMILAAGSGERMRPLTNDTPKALLTVHGKPLIVYHIENLHRCGIQDIVINHAHFGEKIEAALGDGSTWDVTIHYSPEPPGGYETAGGIYHALPLLGNEPFIVVNADIWTDYDFSKLLTPKQTLAHLVLVDNPEHHPEGDFCLPHDMLHPDKEPKFTFAGIGVYHRDFFQQCRPGKFRLAPLLHEAIAKGNVSAEHHPGQWLDIGAPERLALANTTKICHSGSSKALR